MANGTQQAQKQKPGQRVDFRGGVSRLRRQNETEVLYCQNARLLSDGVVEVRNGQTELFDIGATGNIEEVLARSTEALGLKVYSIRRTDGTNDTIYVGESEITGGGNAIL